MNDLYRWIDKLRAAGLSARESFAAIWIRANLRAIAARLATHTVLPNRFAVWQFEQWLMEGMSVAEIKTRMLMYAKATICWNWG